jgi:hypothetical protein
VSFLQLKAIHAPRYSGAERLAGLFRVGRLALVLKIS